MLCSYRPLDFANSAGSARLSDSSPVPPPHLAAPSPSTPCLPIVGLVVFKTHRGERAEAILDTTGRWTCPQLPVLDRVLNCLFSPRPDSSGFTLTGPPELLRVASWIKGEALPSPPPE